MMHFHVVRFISPLHSSFIYSVVGGVPPEMLPTLSFIVSLFMALATGTSWGTMVR